MAEPKSSNAIKYPEVWVFFIKHARNIEKEPDISHLGKYRISIPNESGDFIYAESPEQLWVVLLLNWYAISMYSPSVYGKIQYIVNTF